MNTLLNFIIGLLFLTILVFHKRILRGLRLDPDRARDLFGFFAAYLLLFVLYALICSESFAQRKVPLLAGLFLGVPLGVFQDYFVFRKIKNNILILKWGLGTLVAIPLGLGIGIWAARTRAFPEILSLALGICFMSFVVRLVYIIRHEKKFGVLVISRSRRGLRV